ncbi:hypothetical protein CHS0354_027404 [Potamilus streckersoni]|uniref:Uncharacterized protein n=1 Tax=Potamilus streckersoni TaxID=2493646 RepID=A0AAE0SQW5_9BIVA|nr:hypothetical protein CHS0354_027404 [Potamilus streckersoni]
MSAGDNHPILVALDKAKVSKDLKREFLSFLKQFPEWESQAVYLLKDKKQRVEKIIHDLYGVPPREQCSWSKPTDRTDGLDEDIKEIIRSYKENKKEETIIQRQHIFRDWKQEHGFESIPVEIGDIHTIIRIQKAHSEKMGASYIWSFSRSRYGKRGWGAQRIISNAGQTLLDNNNNPGWAVRQFLEENIFYEIPAESEYIQVLKGDDDNAPDEDTDINITDSAVQADTSAPQIVNPVMLSSYDTHSLLYMLFGHPMIFIGADNLPVKNTLKTAEFAFYYYPLPDYYLLWGTFQISRDGREKTVTPEDFYASSENIILYGNPPGLIYDRRYYRIDETVMSARLIENSLRGIMIPKSEWQMFTGAFNKHYRHIEMVEIYDENFLPEFNSRGVRSWSYWLSEPEYEIPMFDSVTHAVRLYLDPKTETFNSNKIALRIENLEGWRERIRHRDKVPQYTLLFQLLERLTADKVSEDNIYIFERTAVSQILMLAERYPYAFGVNEEPLISVERMGFRITINKYGNELKRFSLTGALLAKRDDKTHILSGSTDESIPKLNVYGTIPCYYLQEGQMWRLEHYVGARLVNDSFTGVNVDESEIMDFYATAVPYLKQRGISINDPAGLLRVSALYNYRISGEMRLWEVNGLLMGRLKLRAKTDIGEFDYPMGIESDEFTQVIDSVKYRIPRHYALEQTIINLLYDHGWLDESDGEYSMREDMTMKFFMETVPAMPEDSAIQYVGLSNLKKWKIQEITPAMATGIKTGINWFDVDLKIEHEGTRIDIEQILNFWHSPKNAIELQGKDGLVVINREWLSKYAPILNRLLESYKNNKDGRNPSKMRVEKFHVGLVNELEQASVKKDTDGSWRETVKTLKEFREVDQIKIPAQVNANLRDYQKDGVRWLCFLRRFGFGGILADDMGLGKTLQVLCFLAVCKEKEGFSGPNLVIAPTSVASNWINEIKKFTPHFKALLLHGGSRKERFSEVQNADLVITTYGLLQRDMDVLSEFEFDILILDEAQMIKNSRSKTNLSVSRLRSRMRVSMSGTPIENSVSELWSQFNFLMPGFLGNIKNFQSLYMNTFQKNSDKKREAFSFLRKQTKPFIMRRMKQQVARELPPKTEQTLYCEMGPEQRQLYEALMEVVRKKIKEKIDKNGFLQAKVTIFDALTKLRQICSDPRLSRLSGDNPPPSAKMGLFTDVVSEIVEEGHRVLVFSHFVKMLNLMHEPLMKRNIAFLQLDGGTKNRGDIVNKFQNDDKYPVMLISLKAGGTGINLTAADYVIHYDPWWNPAAEAQATDRVYRIGQNNQVFVYKLITKNSIEEKILELQGIKLSVAEKIVGISDDLETMLDIDSIREIFRL